MGKVSKRKLLVAIKSTPGGIVSAIADKCGVEWHTVKNAINANPDCLQAWNDQRELFLDVCENVIAKSVASGDTQDAKWVLSRLGKHRGYAERQEITGADGMPVEIKLKWAEDNEPNNSTS